MATQVNKKLVIYIVVFFASAAVILAGLWMLYARADSGRNIRRGDALMAEGDYRNAAKQYARAANKEKSNLEYLEKWEGAILAMQPPTPTEAKASYGELVLIRRSRAIHQPTNLEFHQVAIDDAVRSAQWSGNSIENWQQVEDLVLAMEASLDEDAPEKSQVLAELGRAKQYLSPTEFTDTVDSRGNVHFPGEEELRAAVELDPKNDLAWSSLADGRLEVVARLQLDGRVRQSEQQREFARETFADLERIVADKPRSATALAKFHTIEHLSAVEEGADNVAEMEARRDALLNQMESVIDQTDDVMVTRVACNLLVATDRENGYQRAAKIYKEYLDRNPNAVDIRHELAVLHYTNSYQNEKAMNAAKETAKSIVAGPGIHSSFEAILQFPLRRGAASLLCDIAIAEQQQKKLEDPDADLSEYDQRRDNARRELLDLCGGDEDDPLVLKIDGKIAYNKEQYGTAVEKLESYRAMSTRVERETYMYLSNALAELGQLGLAYERTKEGLRESPNYEALRLVKARLEALLGRYSDASETVSGLPLAMRQDSQEMSDFSNRLQEVTETGDLSTLDPVAISISRALMNWRANDLATGRMSLLEAQKSYPEDARIPEALARLAIMAKDKDAGYQHLEKLRSLDPERSSLRSLELALEVDDPVEAMRLYLSETSEDPDERDLSLASAMRLYIMAQSKRSNALVSTGHDLEGKKVLEETKQAEKQLRELIADLAERMPLEPRVVELRLQQAIYVKDWDQAEQVVQEALAHDPKSLGNVVLKANYELLRGAHAASSGNRLMAQEYLTRAVVTFKRLTEEVPYKESYWYGLAEAYSNLGEPNKAIESFEEAYRRNPNDLEIVKQYANALIQQPDGRNRAIRVLTQALAVAPQNTEIREIWLQLETEEGNIPLVLQTRSDMYQMNPGDVTNAVNLIRILVTSEPSWKYIADQDGSQMYNELSWSRVDAADQQRLLSNLRKQWNNAAEDIIEKLRPTYGSNRAFATLQATLMMSKGDVQGGAQLLRDRIASLGENGVLSDDYVALANYFIEANRFDDAKEALLAAIELNDASSFLAAQQLSNLYVAQMMYPEALGILQQLYDADPSTILQARIIECLIWENRLDEADSELKVREAELGNDYVGRILRAKMLQARGKEYAEKGDIEAAKETHAFWEEQIQHAKDLLPRDPDSYFLQAQGLLEAYSWDDDRLLLEQAVKALDTADQLATNISVRTGLKRVEILRLLGNHNDADSTLRLLVTRFPDEVYARQLLIQSLIEQGRIDAAIEVVEQAIARSRNSPVWYNVLANIHAANGNRNKSIDAYLKAYDLSRQLNYLASVAAVTRSNESWDGAKILAYLEESPELLSNTLIIGLAARAMDQEARRDEGLELMTEALVALLESKDLDAETRQGLFDVWFVDLRLLFNSAESSVGEEFVRSIPGANDRSEVAQGLAIFWVGAGKDGHVRAIEILQDLLNADVDLTDFIRAHHIIGQLRMGDGDIEAAKSHYAAIIEKDGDDARALNNLAYLLIEYDRNAVDALPLSKRAVKIAPDSITMLDTLADIYRELGQAEEAIQVLNGILELSPNNLQALIDVSKVYGESLDQPDKALPFIETAYNNAPNNPTVLDQLGWINFQLGNDLKAEEYLRESAKIQEQPRTYLHLAQVLAIDGRFRAAIQRLNRADELATNPEMKAEIASLRADIEGRISQTVP